MTPSHPELLIHAIHTPGADEVPDPADLQRLIKHLSPGKNDSQAAVVAEDR